MRLLLALLFFAGPLLGQAVNGWAPIENSWSEIQTPPATGTVTTTGTLASGQVALGSGATSITGDAGCTWTGTGASFVGTFGGAVLTGNGSAGAVGIGFSSEPSLGFYRLGSGTGVLAASSTAVAAWFAGAFSIASGYQLTWGLSSPIAGLSSPGAGIVKVTDAGSGVGLLQGHIQTLTGTRPACDATTRGMQWYVAGGAGVADTFECCRKDASDAYAWVTLF